MQKILPKNNKTLRTQWKNKVILHKIIKLCNAKVSCINKKKKKIKNKEILEM